MLVLNSRKMLFQPPVLGVCVDGGLFIHQIQLTIKRMKYCHFTNMDGPRDYHTNRERQIHVTVFMWNIKEKKT